MFELGLGIQGDIICWHRHWYHNTLYCCISPLTSVRLQFYKFSIMSKFAQYADVINEPFTKITKIQLWSSMAAWDGVWRQCVSQWTLDPGTWHTVTDTVAPNITARAKQFIAEARGCASTGDWHCATLATAHWRLWPGLVLTHCWHWPHTTAGENYTGTQTHTVMFSQLENSEQWMCLMSKLEQWGGNRLDNWQQL